MQIRFATPMFFVNLIVTTALFFGLGYLRYVTPSSGLSSFLDSSLTAVTGPDVVTIKLAMGALICALIFSIVYALVARLLLLFSLGTLGCLWWFFWVIVGNVTLGGMAKFGLIDLSFPSTLMGWLSGFLLCVCRVHSK